MQKIIYTSETNKELQGIIAEATPDKVFILCDTTTQCLCLPLLPLAADASIITIPAGDDHKDTESLCHVWKQLQEGGATRHSMLINLGGGMVTDLGGFAASSFKRGIRFINVPTTLLAMVDASVGGKTGINFGGLKNEIGVFNEAEAVIVDTTFLRTLDTANRLSGYAEMLKHSLLGDSEMLAAHLCFDIAADDVNMATLQHLVRQSIELKQRVVTEDPHEKGLRKALNLGHTFGHALESLMLERTPVLHGYAVAWGLIPELYMSVAQCQLPTTTLRQCVAYINEHYGRPAITCKDYDHLYELMQHDKKNCGKCINFTLIAAPGDVRIDQQLTREMIDESWDFLREG